MCFRTPDDDPGGPWCFTDLETGTMEYCSIPLCGKQFEELEYCERDRAKRSMSEKSKLIAKGGGRRSKG